MTSRAIIAPTLIKHPLTLAVHEGRPDGTSWQQTAAFCTEIVTALEKVGMTATEQLIKMAPVELCGSAGLSQDRAPMIRSCFSYWGLPLKKT